MEMHSTLLTLCNTGGLPSQITGVSIVYSTVCSGADQRKHQSSASLAFERVNSPHKGPVTRKAFPFDDVIVQKRRAIPITTDTSEVREGNADYPISATALPGIGTVAMETV